jgi:hypothetical protein
MVSPPIRWNRAIESDMRETYTKAASPDLGGLIHTFSADEDLLK